MKKEKNKELVIKKADDRPKKTSDIIKEIQDFMEPDDKKHFLFFKLIEISDFKEAELIESLLLKLFDVIKEEMELSDVYTKENLADVNFFIQMVKLHILKEDNDNVDLSPPSGVFHVY